MAFSEFLETLELSPESKVLTDSSSDEFKASIQRWSDVDAQIPGAIIKVANEQDAILSVRTISCNRHVTLIFPAPRFNASSRPGYPSFSPLEDIVLSPRSERKGLFSI